MPLDHHALAALASLVSEFEAAARAYPGLGHILIETPNPEAFDEAKRQLGAAFPDPPYPYRGEQRCPIAVDKIERGTDEIQVFIRMGYPPRPECPLRAGIPGA